MMAEIDSAAELLASGHGNSEALGGMATHITYPLHLINGRPVEDPFVVSATAGTRLRLRVINAGAETPYRFSVAGHEMTVVSADGQDVAYTAGDEILIAPAQRYGRIGDGAVRLVAHRREGGREVRWRRVPASDAGFGSGRRPDFACSAVRFRRSARSGIGASPVRSAGAEGTGSCVFGGSHSGRRSIRLGNGGRRCRSVENEAGRANTNRHEQRHRHVAPDAHPWAHLLGSLLRRGFAETL